MLGLYLFFKFFIWCMKVIVIATALMLMAAIAILYFLVLLLVALFNYIQERRLA